MRVETYTIGGKVICFFILIISLCGCSVITGKKESTVYPSWGQRKQLILDWASSEKKKVEEGTLKNSQYWKQFYLKTIELRPDLDHFLCFATEMIKISRIFEEGKITRQQFENKQRQLTVLLSQEENRRAEMLSNIRLEGNEAVLFHFNSKSLFFSYIEDLRRQLSMAGLHFSVRQCDFFGLSIQCTTQNTPF